MNIVDVVLTVVIILAVAAAIFRCFHNIKHGNSCCGNCSNCNECDR